MSARFFATALSRPCSDADSLVYRSSFQATDPVGRGSALVLTDGQMDVLVSLLQSSVTDSDHHNATFSLVREILTTKFLSPGLYDMMDQALCLTVQSQKDSVRQLSRQIFVQFIVD